jgi:hypothetical protein
VLKHIPFFELQKNFNKLFFRISTNMPFANIRISKGSKILHRWYIHLIPYEMTIKNFFDKLVTGKLSPECSIAVTSSEVLERVELNGTLPVVAVIQVSLNCSIIELTKSLGINIYY